MTWRDHVVAWGGACSTVAIIALVLSMIVHPKLWVYSRWEKSVGTTETVFLMGPQTLGPGYVCVEVKVTSPTAMTVSLRLRKDHGITGIPVGSAVWIDTPRNAITMQTACWWVEHRAMLFPTYQWLGSSSGNKVTLTRFEDAGPYFPAQ